MGNTLSGELGLKGRLSSAQIDATLADRRESGSEPWSGTADENDAPAGVDEAAAERLLAKKLAPILREGDPRRRQQRVRAPRPQRLRASRVLDCGTAGAGGRER